MAPGWWWAGGEFGGCDGFAVGEVEGGLDVEGVLGGVVASGGCDDACSGAEVGMELRLGVGDDQWAGGRGEGPVYLSGVGCEVVAKGIDGGLYDGLEDNRCRNGAAVVGVLFACVIGGAEGVFAGDVMEVDRDDSVYAAGWFRMGEQGEDGGQLVTACVRGVGVDGLGRFAMHSHGPYLIAVAVAGSAPRVLLPGITEMAEIPVAFLMFFSGGVQGVILVWFHPLFRRGLEFGGSRAPPQEAA